MRRVGVREFKSQATTMLASGETLVVERYGTPIGFYVPIEAKDREAGHESLARLGDAIAEVMLAAGVDEDEFVREVTGQDG